jgi:phosphomannomutase
MSLMVSISGIRGVVGMSLTPEVVVRYGQAYAAYCRSLGESPLQIVLGRDGRITGPPIADLLASTLVCAGVEVRDLGIVPTPTVQLAVEKEQASGGIAVTASHNPMQWNGMKFLARTGMFLDADENARFWSFTEKPPKYASWTDMGRRSEDPGWIRKHIEAVLSLPYLRPSAISRRRFRIVADCVNAAGGRIVPDLLRALGCDVVEMNCDISGVFSHTPEPIPENLTALSDRVRAEEADLGIAVDPDVDRLVLITETGTPLGEEYTITTAVDFVLKTWKAGGIPAWKSAAVAVNLSTTRAVEDVAHSYGARVYRTPVGEINVARKMKEVGAIVGGEGSGGVILPDVHLGRDAMVGIGLILQHLADEGCTLGELKKTLPRYEICKGKVEVGQAKPDEVLSRIRDTYASQGTITADDGVKIDFPEHWVHLRKSNTEPIVRIIAEAKSAEHAAEVVRAFTSEILRLAS